MKRGVLNIFIITLSVIAIAAYSPNGEFIIGKWKFDRFAIKQGITLSANEKLVISEEEANLKKDKVVIEFLPNNVFKNTEGGYTETGSYSFGDNGQKLILKTDDGPKTGNVVILSKTDLAIVFNEEEISFLVFHFKRLE